MTESFRTPRRIIAAALGALGLVLWAAQAVQAAPVCSAHSTASVTPVVELYTSEGCNSCPPADQWLSRLKSDPGVVALAFHVDYWDRLGWKDRFSSASFTQRQSQQQVSSGAGFSYTPQVIVDGMDRKDWPRITAPIAEHGVAAVNVSIERDGSHFTAMVSSTAGSPARLAAYWAVTDQGFVSNVKAGENEGATLKHDYVVREYRPVAGWAPRPDSPTTLQFDMTTPFDAAHPRQVNLVIVNADTGRPVQAVKLGC